jgi:hypothetical protein
MSPSRRLRRTAILAVTAGLVIAPAARALASAPAPFLAKFRVISTIGSTVPRNGDVNPYGITVIRSSHGKLRSGNVLISNFNNRANLQGTGTTIVELDPSTGGRTRFAQISGRLPGSCPGGVGLSTALAVLPGGWVVVGSTPSANGQAATAKAGCLIVLDNQGRVRETISGHGINGPWDATTLNRGRTADLFVTNVLNGTAATTKQVNRGSVLRLDLVVPRRGLPRVRSFMTIGSGFSERASKSAFVLGPTGLALGGDGTLYVASTRDNSIAGIPDADLRQTDAGTGLGISARGELASPLGLTMAPNGDILAVNGSNGKIVEIQPGGQQVATAVLDSHGKPAGAGALFGLTVVPGGGGVYYVDDAVNTLRLLH